MPKKTEIKRPKIIDRLIAAYKDKTAAIAEFEHLKEKAKTILEKRSFSDVKMSSSTVWMPDPVICDKWLKEQLRSGNISRELFKSFYLRTFDQGAFIEACATGKIKRKMLPKGAFVKKVSERVTFTIGGRGSDD